MSDLDSATSGQVPASAPIAEHASPSTRRKWCFRLAACLFGLSLFVVAEAVCWLLGAGEPSLQDDPFVGFDDLQPLFVRDNDGGRFRIAPGRLKFFAEDSFPAHNDPETFRIFCLGGSTVQGRPYSKETSFTTWLRLALEEADPGRRWEVVNCGGISYASYRLVPILQECLEYQPDLFIVCTGHNEFLEDRTYGELRQRTPWLAVPHGYLSRLRSYHVFRNLMLQTSDEQSVQKPHQTLGGEVDALLDYNEGLRAYHRDDAWRNGIIQHFEFNLERMARICRERKVPLVFVLPPSNLADAPPFKSEHRAGLTPEELAEFERLVEQAMRSAATDALGAAQLLESALEIDSEFAAVHFHLGKLYESLGEFSRARQEFVAAREHDICPLRMLAPMETTLRDIARARSVPLLDAHALLEAQTEHGILDASMLVDHVHPDFAGHQLIALALVEQFAEMKVLNPHSGWREASRQSFQRHFDALPPIYFAKGQQTLENVRFWTKGQADGPPIEERYPERVRD